MKKPNQTKAPNKLIDMNAPVLQYTVAEVVGVSQQAISAMVNSGKLPPCQTTGELIAAYCARLREQAAGRLGDTVGGLDPAHESAALKRAQREGQEIKNAVLRGEYASITLLAEVLASASQSVVERLDQLSAALRKTCPDLPEAARDQVMSTIASARNEWVRATCELVAARLVVDLGDEFPTSESSDVE